MPTYDFEDIETGEKLERWLPITEAPEIGAVITDEDDGRKLRRLVSLPQKPSLSGHQYHRGIYRPMQIPLNHPDAPHKDEMGRAIFTNTSEERDFMRKTGASRDNATVDAGSDNEKSAKSKRTTSPHRASFIAGAAD